MSLLQPHIDYKPGHVRALDGLRGVAIGLVMLYHLFGPLFGFGWMGVDLFFVLSGFLITGILIDTRHKAGYLRNFFGRRVLRIFPLYYFFLAIVLFVVARWEDVSWYIEHQWWFWTYLENWKYAIDGWPKQDFLHHFWSLAIEEQFYVIWPFVVLAVAPKRLFWVALILIATAIAFRILGPELFGIKRLSGYVSTLGRADALLIGACLAMLVRTRVQLLEKLIPWLLVGSALVVAGILAVTRDPGFSNPAFKSVGFTILDLMFGCLLIYALSNRTNRLFNRALESKPLVFLGKYSYGLYVYHWPVYLLMKSHFFPWLTSMELPAMAVRMTNSLLTAAIAVVLSLLSYHALEKHFLKLKRYFAFDAPRTTPVADAATSGTST